ncbi:DNA gyrase inhibitor YacG [Sulfuricystis multivorans]|uniref:DNA gyrase inhibitor YacG n=1 Tax=Sulfuricystis multivorans TaxID=2211108 RepID=UPI000F83E0CD|nr:DNA gyrase inhibitor YacG [Sulfuricystis multivorans]
MTQARIVNCPQCGKPVPWGPQSPFRPFCSERCKKIDLGAWANDEYRIPGTAPPDDFSAPEPDATPRG